MWRNEFLLLNAVKPKAPQACRACQAGCSHVTGWWWQVCVEPGQHVWVFKPWEQPLKSVECVGRGDITLRGWELGRYTFMGPSISCDVPVLVEFLPGSPCLLQDHSCWDQICGNQLDGPTSDLREPVDLSQQWVPVTLSPLHGALRWVYCRTDQIY